MGCLPPLVTALLCLVSAGLTSTAGVPIHLKALGPANRTLTFYPDLHLTEAAAYLAIDGVSPNGTNKPVESRCAGTGDTNGTVRWIRIDLGGLYSVQSVSVSSLEYRGDGVTVRVGNSLINSGLDNYQCGGVWRYSSSGSPYFSGTFRNFTCDIPQWARYVTIRRDSSSQDSLVICEVQVFYTSDTGQAVLHLHHLSENGIDAVQGENTANNASLALDGIPVFNLTKTQCAKTTVEPGAWLRVDLKQEYGITAVRAVRGWSNVRAQVGNNVITNSDMNPQCGPEALLGRHTWHVYSCNGTTLNGQYINLIRYKNVNKYGDSQGSLIVCELEFFYKLTFRTSYNGSSLMNSSVVQVTEGQGVMYPFDCGVYPPNATLVSYLGMTWRMSGGAVIPQKAVDSNAAATQERTNLVQRLMINNPSKTYHDGTVLSCSFQLNNQSHEKSFQLQVNVVDCSWSEWIGVCSNCGRPTRTRTIVMQPSENGKSCGQEFIMRCSASLPPCQPVQGYNAITVNETSVAVLTCSAEQYPDLNPAITFTWMKGESGVDSVISEDSLVKITHTPSTNGSVTSTLTFSRISRKDAGVYMCVAVGAGGNSSKSSGIVVTVNSAPQLVTSPQSGFGNLTLPFTLWCRADGHPPPTYTWRKLGQRDAIAKDQVLGNLTFDGLNFTDSGNYTCTAMNFLGQTTSDAAELIVQGRPDICFAPKLQSPVANSVKISTECFHGNAPITQYDIQFGSSSLGPWETFVSNGSYSIFSYTSPSLAPYEFYYFRVRAENRFDKSPSYSQTTRQRIAEAAPGKPLAVKADSNVYEMSAIVGWKEPLELNGMIMEYVVYYLQVPVRGKTAMPGEKTVAVIPPQLWVNLTDLTPYTQYRVQVEAVNVRTIDTVRLVGPRSDVSLFTTAEAAPSEPLVLRAIPLPPDQIEIYWQQPEVINGLLRNYTIEYQSTNPPGQPVNVFVSSSVTSYRIGGLQLNYVYSIKVAGVTVRAGPFIVTSQQLAAQKPSHPINVIMQNSTTKTLTIRWDLPLKPNGIIQFYTVYYVETGSTEAAQSVQVTGMTEQELTSLSPYTNYTITVTATNNAQVNATSETSSPIMAITKIAKPVDPVVGVNSVVEITTSTAVYTLPVVEDKSGPVSYVAVVVYEGEIGEDRPSPLELSQLSSYQTGTKWYIAAYFTYSVYQPGIQFTVGDGTVTMSPSGERYQNEPLQPMSKYFAYTLVVGYNEQNAVVYTYSTASDFVTALLPSKADSSNTGATVGGVVAALVIILVIVLIVIIVLRRWKRSGQTTLTSTAASTVYAKNTDEDGYAEIRLNSALEAPVISHETLSKSVTVDEGSHVLLPCDATGIPPPSITWECDGKALAGQDERIVQLSTGALKITNVLSSDAGFYVCRATNKAGKDEMIVELSVQSRQKDMGTGSQQLEHHVDSKSSGLSVDEFSVYIESLHANQNVGFLERFERLREVEPGVSFSVALQKQNLTKNRYKNIVSYDHARVVLPDLPGMASCDSDYINAAVIDGYCRPRKYIASQGPLPNTCSDMWRMVWAENSPSIVMLTHLVEGQKIKCHQYWPDVEGCSVAYNGLNVTLTKSESFAGYELRKFKLDLAGAKSRTVKQYHFTVWPDHGVPRFATVFLGFMNRLRREYPKGRGPMIVHCSAGVGRTGTFIVVDTMLDRIADKQPIDIDNCITEIRTRRQEMVQTKDQYMFIHDVVMEAVLCGNTQIQVQNLRAVLSDLHKSRGSGGESGFELEFKVLQATSPQMNKSQCRAGSHTAVQNKNRYQDVLPLDARRVILVGESMTGDTDYVNTQPGVNYINASYLNGYRRRDAFIVTQGPLDHTVNDFWQMVWEQDCPTIVMLTNLEEDGTEMCSQYWPSTGSITYGKFTVSAESIVPGVDYNIRKFKLSLGSNSKTVMQFHYCCWACEGLSMQPTQLLDLLDQVQKWQQSTGDKKIVVHCSNSLGRTGVFCAVFSLIELIKVEGIADVFHKVKEMRIQRPGIVQTLDQYKLCYIIVMEFLDRFDTYSNFK